MVGTSWIGASWLTLEDTTESYKLFTDTLLTFRDKLPSTQAHTTRYEDTVADISVAGQKVTEFLGLTWYTDQAKFHEHASNKHVHSPTYSDVAKPIYTSALEKWRNYETYMQPILEKLNKHQSILGYD